MKKTLIAVAAAAALTTSAFAEITFGAWLRVLAAPVANDGKDTVAAMGNSWGYGARVARLNINATAEDGKAGFDMGIYNDVKDGLGTGDQWSIWAKPTDKVKVSYGKYDNNTLRGDCCYGSWNWLRPVSSWMVEDEGLLMSGNGETGALIEATPVDGLYVQLLVPYETTAKKAEDVYKNIRGGFAYNIEGVGKLKAQLILKGTPEVKDTVAKGYYDKDNNSIATPTPVQIADGTAKYNAGQTASDAFLDKKIEAEFDLTSVENLWLGVGFSTTMVDDVDNRYQDADGNNIEKMKFAVGATYQVNDQLKVSASGAYRMFQKGKSDGGEDGRFQAGAGIDYNLGDGINVSADVRYLGKQGVTNNDNTDHIAFSVGATKGISSNGYMGVAFQAQTNSGNWANTVIKANTSDGEDKLTWCVPVAISVWF